MENKNLEHAIKLQEKFEFYFIALVFTILGISLQTAKLGGLMIQSIIEISAWLLLLTSGLSGLSRLSWLPVAFRNEGENDDLNEHLVRLNTNPTNILTHDGSKELSPTEISQKKGLIENGISDRKTLINQVEAKSSRLYRLHKWGFVLGISLLVISRAIALIDQ